MLGGHVYRRYGLPYNSPTVGLYFFADDYIKLLSNLKKYLESNLEIIPAEKSNHYQELKQKQQLNVPIGLLGEDVEVVFLHCLSSEEAIEKWNRRVKRVNYNNLIVKFSEMNGCSSEHLKAFHKMKFHKKILFLAKPDPNVPEGIVIKKYTKNGCVVNDTTYYSRHLELTSFINK